MHHCSADGDKDPEALDSNPRVAYIVREGAISLPMIFGARSSYLVDFWCPSPTALCFKPETSCLPGQVGETDADTSQQRTCLKLHAGHEVLLTVAYDKNLVKRAVIGKKYNISPIQSRSTCRSREHPAHRGRNS